MNRLRGLFRDDIFEDRATLGEQVVGQVEGGKQANDCVVRAVHQQPTFEALLNDARPRDGQLDANHGPFDANFANLRTAPLE